MVRRTVWPCLLLAVIILVPGAAVRAAAVLADGLRQWDPSASWSGGEDEDTRLDKPVQFWRAGLPLGEVFASIEQQTDVKLRFYPEDDANRRVPVHLFLSPQEPPTLRALMAQLSWVVDCPFLVREEEGAKTYLLLSARSGTGGEERLRRQVEAVWKARRGKWEEIGGKLEEFRQALTLSREEAIARYQGQDDLLLLNLLDPPRRAATQFMCRHASVIKLPERPGMATGIGSGLMGFGLTVPSASFTADDIADLGTAFGLPESVLRDPSMAFDLHVEVAGQLRVNAAPEYTQKARPPGQGHYGPYRLVDLAEDSALTAAEELALRRGLGEDIPAEREAEYLRQHAREIAADKEARELARLKAERSLSPRAEEMLASTMVTLRGLTPDLPIAAWQAQEAVARATGRSVVSDGLLWWGRYDWPPQEDSQAKETTLTALAALDSFTHLPAETGLSRPSWEWGDAGDFLRFRTADREVWREAMLPPEFLAWVASVVAPHLPDPAGFTGRQWKGLSIPVGFVYSMRMLASLSELQLAFGRQVNVGNPNDLGDIVRHEVTAALLCGVGGRFDLVRFLGSLTDAQWEQMKGAGLPFGTGLSPTQQQLLAEALTTPSSRHQSLADMVLTTRVEKAPERGYSLHVRRPDPRRAEGESGPEGSAFPPLPGVLRVTAWAPERDTAPSAAEATNRGADPTR